MKMTSAPNDQLGDSSLNVLTAVSCGAMTVSWMIACASFTAAPLLGRRFSLADAAISFSSAAVAASWLRKLGGRNLLMAGLHTVVLTLLLAHALHKFFSPTAEFFDWGWIRALYGQMHRMPAFAAAALAAGWTAAFWAAGVKLGRRPLNYLTVCNRFDLGLTALFSLLLIQLVLVTRGGVSIAAPPEAHFVYGFFVCGLTAIGLARIRGTAAKRTLTGLRGVVILLVLSVTALATTGLLASLAPPILTPAAEDAYGALKIVAAPLGTMITRFLLFIFGREYDSPAAVGSAAGSTAVPVADPPGTWWIWLANLTARGLASLLALALLALSGYALWRLGQWLLKKKTGAAGTLSPFAVVDPPAVVVSGVGAAYFCKPGTARAAPVGYRPAVRRAANLGASWWNRASPMGDADRVCRSSLPPIARNGS